MNSDLKTGAGGELPKQAPQTLRAVIDNHADKHPEKPYLIDPISGASIHFGDLKRHAQAVANALAKRGLQPGDPVAYAMGNSPETALVILGMLYGGYLATALNLIAGRSTLAYVLDHSEAKLIFADEAGLAALMDVAQERDLPDIVEVSPALFESQSDIAPALMEASKGGILMYTSGTTGQPKGVVLSQANVLAGGANTAEAHALTQADCGLCVLPLYHINGLCVTVMGALVSGGSLIIPRRFSVSTFWQTVSEFRCTWFSVVPTQISYLLHEPDTQVPSGGFPHVRFGRSASAPLSPDVQSAFEAKFGIPIIETMGLTETAAQILSNPLPPGIRKIGSPGIAFGNEVRIADANQQDLPFGCEGEVLVRGPNVMQRYLKNEAETRQAITPQGWLRTGDMGRMDKDGYVFITGRLKELIIKGGENIAPREVDEALYSHPDVVEAAAFACPCDRYGERVEAAVRIKEGVSVSQQDLIALCKSKLGSFKSPDRVHFLQALPKGPSGKIQRMKLAESCKPVREETSPTPAK